ncbi:hypothetical protein [Prochlorococcus sp. MIT 1307]|uniref:hypothetical protein n=1 Tax=Prochlorococcus sp. MIT 1307 TaxID=3096219 RepID=UPI002A759576|nr:hypothetical protein [Prochlorococcus sp. MIT 1307]
MVGSISITKPSFKIKDAEINSEHEMPWDSINSQELILKAKRIYFQHISNSSNIEMPIGVVLNLKNHKGKIVYRKPTLLLNEYFVELKYLVKGKVNKLYSKSLRKKKAQ